MHYNGRLTMAAEHDTTMDITYRHCTSEADYAACEALQAATWGTDDVVPMTLLKAAQKIGGIAAGAFDPSGRMLGCVFGMSGVRDGKPVHWSHMLTVLPEARGMGLGFGLKIFQRNELVPLGIEVMHWTFDPLEAVNAHFNINRLGALPVEYVLDMYGEGGTNLLHQGLGTDRFIAQWDLTRERPTLESRSTVDAPVINHADRIDAAANGSRIVLIEAPKNIQTLKKSEPDTARDWRNSTRRAFQYGFENGYSVTGFQRADDHRCYYILELNDE